MQCLKCKKECKAIVSAHLKKCSGISLSQYRLEFPNAKLVDDEIAKSYGLPGVLNPNYKHGKSFNPTYCVICSNRLALANSSGYCVHCYAAHHENNFKHKTHTEQTKHLMAEKAKFRDRSTYKGGPGSQTSEQISARAKLRYVNETKEDRLKRLSAWILAGQKSRRSSLTKIEKQVASWIPLSYQVKQNENVLTYYVDILIDDSIIIECYGDYWHCNPKIYSSDYYNSRLKMLAKQKHEKDEARIQKLKDAGYKVLILWEDEITKSPDKAKEKINEILRKE